jgi:ATP-binding cassette, subfamily B, bacterial CvaB/MchF/RaxB
MSFTAQLDFGLRKKLPLVLQTEAAECGLACLAMITGFYGHPIELRTLRQRFPISLKGTGLAQLIQIANRLELVTRPLKLSLEELGQLKRPCLLHWNFNHFVVLKAIDAKRIVIHDPAQGVRTLSLSEASASFTGVALELWPTTQFQPHKPPPSIKLRHMMGQVSGLYRSLSQIILLSLTLEVFALLSPFLLQWVIDHVLVGADRDLLTTLVLGFFLLLLMQQAVSAIRAWALMYLGSTLNLQWRANVLTHLLKLPTHYFEKRHMGDLVSRFGAVDTIQQTLTSSFLAAILDGLMAIATLAMMLIYSRLLGSIAIGAMVLYTLGRWLWYRPLRTANEEGIIHQAKQHSHFLETIRGIKTIKLFSRQDERRSSWLTLLVKQINAGLRAEKLQVLYQQLNGLLFGIEGLLIVWLGARMVIDGHFTVGVLMAFTAYKNQFASRVSSLIDKFFEVKMLQLQGERLADIVLTPPEAQAPDGQEPHCILEGSIEAKEIQYRYANGEKAVLEGITFKINAGESVAIVGPSGCGKTTLIHVLLGILPPTQGQILIGGVEISRVGIESLRRIAGTVMQDDVLFAGSVSDNISFFDPQADQNWVVECARRAAVHDEIAAMPMAYNTLVGDMGTTLSGGQKQRVLLARALYKRPKILFLDEATSHLDLDLEKQVNAAIQLLNITRIIVAHRPDTIASADRVIAL